jgi:hypothetical protein
MPHHRRDTNSGPRSILICRNDARSVVPNSGCHRPRSRAILPHMSREDTREFGEVIAAAFPRSLSSDVASVASIIPPTTTYPIGEFTVRVAGERLAIPYRFYNDEPLVDEVASLSARQQLLLHTLFIRHHNGYVRQKHLQQAIRSVEEWTPPYVVSVIGEYVVELIQMVAEGLDQLEDPHSPQSAIYGRYVADNRAAIALIEARAASYWNVYYRTRFPRFAQYPSRALVARLRIASEPFGAS